jgi:hypothetical protein
MTNSGGPVLPLTTAQTVDPTYGTTPMPSPPVLSPATLAQAVRTIHPNRPVETFSAQDVADIKYAAECLSMICCNRESFELYTTILKRQLSDPMCRDATFWYLVIQCAHTASIPEHVEVVQNIIRAEVARLQQLQSVGRSPPVAIFLLLHMLLAFTASRSTNSEDLAASIARARFYLSPGEKGIARIFQDLPPGDRSLDLVIYGTSSAWVRVSLAISRPPAPLNSRPLAPSYAKTRFRLRSGFCTGFPGPSSSRRMVGWRTPAFALAFCGARQRFSS